MQCNGSNHPKKSWIYSSFWESFRKLSASKCIFCIFNFLPDFVTLLKLDQKQLLQVFKNSLKFFIIHRKTLVPGSLLKKRLWQRCFPVNFEKNFKNTFFHRTPSGDCFWIEHSTPGIFTTINPPIIALPLINASLQ